MADPVSGKSYLYWGNGYMAGAELNEDMVSIKKNKKGLASCDTSASYGFSRAVDTDNCDLFFLVDMEVDILQNFLCAECF